MSNPTDTHEAAPEVIRPDVPSSAAVEAHYQQSAQRRRSARRLIWGVLVGCETIKGGKESSPRRHGGARRR